MSARSVTSMPLITDLTFGLPSQMCSTVPLSQSYSRCDELRVRIHENHLSYLNREETPAKLEMRTKIECLIAEYLSLVPNSHKFSFPEVYNCLNASITENADFSPYKASNAFEALEKYATNLITLPWRSEYHSICPYSGFYRHIIDKHIIGAQKILFLMGFVENHSTSIYQLVPPIDPDRVSRVSLECLVAFVELQIMIQIRESLKSKGYLNVSWKEIYAIRVEYICGQSDAIKLICEMKRTAKLIDYDNNIASNGTKRLINSDDRIMSNGFCLIDDNNINHLKQSTRGKYLDHNLIDNSYNDFEDTTDSFDLLNYPIISPHSYSPSPSCQYCLPHNSPMHSTKCSSFPSPHMTYISPPPLFATYPTNSQLNAPKNQSVSKAIQAEIPMLTTNNDLENSLNKLSFNNKKSMSETDSLSAKTKSLQLTKKDSSQSTTTTTTTTNNNNNNNNNSNDKTNKRGSYYDNLDPFVSLEAQVLSELKSTTNSKQSDKNMSSNNESNGNQNSLEKKKLIDSKSLSKIVNSVKPNSNTFKFTSNSNDKKQTSLQTVSLTNSSHLTSSVNSSANNDINGKTRSDEVKCDNQKKQSKDSSKLLKGWSCTSCTYFNADLKEVCEMCHRSRKVGAEAQPLISGGRECSRCTLVNDKNEHFCRACDTSLADSPTYI
ncbi:putative uncharacterized protein DDB_G0277255 [Oppia nitens]|uniref:putative uncharacterized protein DDB_G0277255 n=1 Tax=Oppia nitens TaxID=1686743 RepID=UPI0023DA5C50|nr:putative uncharacterized protein DDB_G0277255 [Oppia nitens]